MIKVIIKDENKGTEEVIEMPQDAWNRILKLIEEDKLNKQLTKQD